MDQTVAEIAEEEAHRLLEEEEENSSAIISNRSSSLKDTDGSFSFFFYRVFVRFSLI